MYAIAIRDFISKIPVGEIIRTRDVLHLGPRNTVDKTLSRMKQANDLIRVAWGMYMRVGSDIPRGGEVAVAKAKAFARSLANHGKKLAHSFGLTGDETGLGRFYSIDGGSSFFTDRANNTSTTFLSTCSRKRYMDETKEGRDLLALWALTKKRFEALSDDEIKKFESLGPDTTNKFAAALPHWITDRLLKLDWKR
ncbi:MAG: hypothetical protein KGS72_18080 [Cyanobacteria bacterium REEB67]|nr:hypothetical protein [Cyanobacteria bacterium REEB67]